MQKLIIALVLTILTAFVATGQKDNCKGLKRSVDEFTGKIIISSPYFQMGGLTTERLPMYIYKIIGKGHDNYTLVLEAHGAKLIVGLKGVIIIFADGTKMQKPTKIDCHRDYSEDSYIAYKYSAYIPLTEDDLEILKTKAIKNFRLDIYAIKVGTGKAKTFIRHVNCIIKK